jgi:hypothetical protein
MRVFDSKGHMLVFSYVAGPPNNQVDFPSVIAAAGAFPLTGGEQAGTSYNYGVFEPGNYTVFVADGSGKGGTILFELYVLSGTAVGNPLPVTLPQ